MLILTDKQSIEAGKKELKNRAKKNTELFLRELEKRSKDGSGFSDDDFIDELRCEIDMYRGYHNEREILEYFRTVYFLETRNIRRDLAERACDSYNEEQIRNELAGILKRIRISSNNGLKDLSINQQYDKLCSWLSDVNNILGNDNLYLSNRIDEKGRLVPLRKDITKYVFLNLLGLFKEDAQSSD